MLDLFIPEELDKLKDKMISIINFGIVRAGRLVHIIPKETVPSEEEMLKYFFNNDKSAMLECSLARLNVFRSATNSPRLVIQAEDTYYVVPVSLFTRVELIDNEVDMSSISALLEKQVKVGIYSKTRDHEICRGKLVFIFEAGAPPKREDVLEYHFNGNETTMNSCSDRELFKVRKYAIAIIFTEYGRYIAVPCTELYIFSELE